MNWLNIGWRNIVKNRRRSTVTILAVAFGFAAINLFAGYIKNVYTGLSDQAVRGERLGHLTVVKRGLFLQGKLHPEKYLFSEAELRQVGELLRADPAVRLISPRLSVSGIVSNGKASTIFIGEGIVPTDVDIIRGDFRVDRGGRLYADRPAGAAVAIDLSQILGLERGEIATLLTTTVEGQANALDMEVADVLNTGNAGTNDKFVLMPFSFAQRLFDTSGGERIVLLLDDVRHTEAARERIADKLRNAGLDVEVRTWVELSSFYLQVKNLMDMIFLFIFSIVFTIVVMSVINTMSMTVMERTREIGTLRALGMKRRSVVRLFVTEGTLLAVIGCAVGLVLSAIAAAAVNFAGISYVPPNFSDPVALLVDIDAGKVAQAFFFLVVLAGGSTFVPARKASRMRVIDALGHV
jgi:putative ABC transport system permease protein